ncbi:hypothetical protein SAMD00019534_077200 [Acytostelium subglobosum LB1]|uniref:hypothetical protein n=1 Tax=Acytostelium subglobosum LB1 TaxID=1410327 RepID=UPI000644CB1D|nr:hypothetical protein SAMD00019534_077200 [Acytostelium subglobosum LB1]GAM24545.1 hypothetical protein SAMD00019534_077200 [Acytostelium subglobosum LB1]|eukprot:XP_012752214.1 hypothetical protein SAMD00019534_077200 [Acytostelium subglobosum LB1]
MSTSAAAKKTERKKAAPKKPLTVAPLATSTRKITPPARLVNSIGTDEPKKVARTVSKPKTTAKKASKPKATAAKTKAKTTKTKKTASKSTKKATK